VGFSLRGHQSGKAIGQFFWQSLIFFRTAASSLNVVMLYLLNAKMEFIPSFEMKCPKFGLFRTIDESGKAML